MRNSPFSQEKLKKKSKPQLFPPSYEENLYLKGSIKKIKLINFQTFEKISIFPGPGFNLILGTNGSGKSSIISAIGLCLGLPPNLINKSLSYSSFIRNGYNQSIIKLLIKNDPDIFLCCTLISNKNPNWKIKKVNSYWKDISIHELNEFTRKLNIQIDNLCMFLPQERVKEFTTLTSHQLLIETIKVLSPPDYYNLIYLKELFNNINSNEISIKELEKKSFELNQKIKNIKIDFNKYQKLEIDKNHLILYNKKIEIINYSFLLNQKKNKK